ncbi:MAG: Ig-like domain-containing protein [Rhodocyclaceae bacterium]|nr:Ig-like domain-containing protein [Rhodocyclaceae bacterium]
MERWKSTSLYCYLSRLLHFGIVAILLSAHAVTAQITYGVNQCAGSRFNSNLGCTANDVQLNSITVAGTPPASCVGGATLPLNLNVTVNFGSSTRYDIGVFLSRNGTDPSLVSSGNNCSVGVLPTSSPFWGSVASGGDGDLCGDGGNNLTGSFVMVGSTVPCLTDGSGNFTLFIPYVISWDQQSTNYCGDNTYPVPGTTSKCNKGTVSFPPGTAIVVLPAITITDGVTTAKSGDTLTYTVVITNTTGSLLNNAVFTLPAVANLAVGSVSCSAGGGAICPASPTVSAMQGAGITLPSMPINSSLTFTVSGTVGSPAIPTPLTNTARVTVSGQTNSASDTDTLVVPPTATKSFSPSAIALAPSGTSTLAITLVNPNAVAVSGVAFTDFYPSGMTNGSPPTLTNSCGGTATANADGALLSLSGGAIAANGSCVVSVRVTASATGINHTGTVTTTNAGSRSAAASGTLQVVSATNSTVVANPTSIPNDGTSTSTITVTLKDTAGNPVVGKTITLTAGSGSSTITTVSGVTDASGQAIFTVKDTVQESVTYTARDTTDGVTIIQTATVTFSSVNGFNAFETSTAASAITGNIYTKLAGTAFGLDVVAISGGSKATGFNNNVKVELLANTGTAGSGYGADNCPISGSVIQTVASAAISGGRSTVNFSAVASAYQDVRVRISYPTISPTIVACSTDSFAIRPRVFTITSTNATNTGTGGAPTFKAGSDNFNLTASAVAGYGGTPLIDNTLAIGTPTAGAISGGFGAANTASGVAVGNSFTYSEVGNLGLNANAVYDDSFTSIDQSGDCSNDFSNTPVSDKYGCRIGSTAVAQTTGSSGFGRFIPNHFILSAASITPAGGTFSYMDQPFGVAFTLTAVNASGSPTTNYSGSYAKLDATNPALWPSTTLGATGFGLGAKDGSSDLSTRLSVVGMPSGTWINGVATVAANLKFSRPITSTADATWGPYEALDIGIAPQDGDGVRLLPTVLNLDADSNSTNERQKLSATPTKQRFGRLRLINAYGSELLRPRVEYRTEYWDGTRWVTNIADMGGTASTLPCPMPFAQATCAIFVVGGGLTVSGVTALTGGVGFVTFNTAVPGFHDIAINLNASGNDTSCNPGLPGLHGGFQANLPWLQGFWSAQTNCNGTPPWRQDPNARIRLGSPKAPYIYLRERY